jgi:hypothetical protein
MSRYHASAGHLQDLAARHAQVRCERVRIDKPLWLRMLEGCAVAGIRTGRLVWEKRIAVELS